MQFVCLLAFVVLVVAGPAHADQVFPPKNAGECGPDTALNWDGDGDVYCRPLHSGSGAMVWTAVDLTDTEPFSPQCDYRLKLRDPANHDHVVYFSATVNYPGDGFSGVLSDDVNSIVATTSCFHAWVNSDVKANMRPWGTCSFAPMTEYFGLESRCPH